MESWRLQIGGSGGERLFLILSMIRNWPFFLHTVVFIVSAFCIWWCLVAPGLMWEPDVMFGGSFVSWSYGGDRREARGIRSGLALEVLSGAGLERGRAPRMVLWGSQEPQSSNTPTVISDIVGESAEGVTETLQVQGLRQTPGTPLSLHVQTCLGIME